MNAPDATQKSQWRPCHGEEMAQSTRCAQNVARERATYLRSTMSRMPMRLRASMPRRRFGLACMRRSNGIARDLMPVWLIGARLEHCARAVYTRDIMPRVYQGQTLIFYVRVDVTDAEDAADHFAVIRACKKMAIALRDAGYEEFDRCGGQVGYPATGTFDAFTKVVRETAAREHINVVECRQCGSPGLGLFEPPFFGNTTPMVVSKPTTPAQDRDLRRRGVLCGDELLPGMAIMKICE